MSMAASYAVTESLVIAKVGKDSIKIAMKHLKKDKTGALPCYDCSLTSW